MSPAAAFHIFWQASPRSFGTADEEAAELRLQSNNFGFI